MSESKQFEELEIIYQDASNGVLDPMGKVRKINPDSPVIAMIEKLMASIGFSLDEALVTMYEIDHNGFDLVKRK